MMKALATQSKSAEDIAVEYYKSRSGDLEKRYYELVAEFNALGDEEIESLKATVEPHNKALEAYIGAYRKATERATVAKTLSDLDEGMYHGAALTYLPFYYLYEVKGFGLAIVFKIALGILLLTLVWQFFSEGAYILGHRRRNPIFALEEWRVVKVRAALFGALSISALMFAPLPTDARIALAIAIMLTHALVAGVLIHRQLRGMPAFPNDGGTPFAARWFYYWDKKDRRWYKDRVDQPRVLKREFDINKIPSGRRYEHGVLEVVTISGSTLFYYDPAQGTAEKAQSFSHGFYAVFPHLEKQMRKRNKAFEDYANTARRLHEVLHEKEEVRKELEAIEAQVQGHIELAKAWRGIYLPDETVRDLLASLDLFVKGDPATPSGLLLYGPPGTGKTTIARRLAETGACNFIATGASQLKSGYEGGTEENVRKLWEEARSKAPCIIFVDECEEAFISRTSPNISQSGRALVNSFLAEWQGFNPTQGVWVIGATNHPSSIDTAVMSRFGRSVEISLPNANLRRGILEYEIENMKMALEVTQEMVDATAGLSGRDIGTFVASIRRNASLSNSEDNPSQEHIKAAIREMRGRSSTRVSEQATWSSLVLNERLKTELMTISRMLRDAEALQQRGIDLPSGILLYGPPGTGKTTIARVLANESGLHFEAPTLAQLKAGYEGQTAQQVRDIFERTRANSPAILYLDEIDTVVPRRGSRSSSGFTDDLVSQLLQEMDGVRSDSRPVFIVASTNRLDQLDEAIVSRFSRKVEIGLPDAKGREEILRVLLSKKPVDFEIDRFAARFSLETEGWSPRDLREAVKRAEMRATTRKYVNEVDEEVTLREEDFAEDDDSDLQGLSPRFLD